MRDAGVEKEAGLAVITNLETVEEQEEMLRFMQQNPTATNRQAVLKTKEIIERRKQNFPTSFNLSISMMAKQI